MGNFSGRSVGLIDGAMGISCQRETRRGPLRLASEMAFVTALGLAACSSGSSDALRTPGDGLTGGTGQGPSDGGGSTLYEYGEVLAAVELEPHDLDDFVLRATIPLPPRVYPLPGGSAPFAFRDSNGVDTPAQVEVVSWYAATQDGADVVELLAKVQRPATHAGQRLRYEVVWAPHSVGDVDVDADVQALVDLPLGAHLRGRDVFNHVYRADLMRDLRSKSTDLRVLRDGAVAYQTRGHETMMPATAVPGSSGTLPHFLGVHSFVTLWDEEPFFSLDLRVHNGHDGLDPNDPTDDPLGKLYFRELELVLPLGWTVHSAFEDPMFGEAYEEGGSVVWPIVMPMPGGKLHMMPQQGQFHRRLMVAKAGAEHRSLVHLREEGLAFCRPGESAAGRELFSWWNPETARFFPQKERLPELWHVGEESVRDWLYGRFRIFEDALRNGSSGPFPITTGNLGWAHPWGLNIGYAHGGDEIHLFDGLRTAYGASNSGYRLFQVTHRMSTERHPVALFDGDGDAFTLEDWIVTGPNGDYVPVYIWIYPVLFLGDPFGFTTSPSFQRDAVEAMALKPDYESTLLGWQNIDRAHLIRYTRSPKVLAWLGNDALAKDDLRMQGELARVSYTKLPQGPTDQHIYTGLLNDRVDVDSNPNNGIAIHRGEGWGADAMVAAYCLGSREWRAKTRSWFYDILELLEDGTSNCTGIIQGDPNLDTFHGDHRSRQSISCAIMENAFWGMLKSVFGERDPDAYLRLSHVLTRDLYAMISELVWNEEYNAPWFYIAVGPYDLTLPEYCGDYPDDGFLYVDNYQTWCAFAYGYRLTGDPMFLDKAALMLGQPLSTPTLGDTGFGLLENRVALLSLVQELFE